MSMRPLSLVRKLLALTLVFLAVPYLAKAADRFRTAIAYPTAVNAYSIAAKDYNGDGIVDMAVVNYNGGNAGIVSVLSGNGDGTFAPAVNYNTGLGPRFMATAPSSPRLTIRRTVSRLARLLSPTSIRMGSRTWRQSVNLLTSLVSS